MGLIILDLAEVYKHFAPNGALAESLLEFRTVACLSVCRSAKLPTQPAVTSYLFVNEN